MATNGHIATARNDPSAAVDLEAGKVLNLGEFANDITLNLSEARIVLQKSLEARHRRLTEQDPSAQPMRETETLSKTRQYLDFFAVFKNVDDAEAANDILNTYINGGMAIEKFERSQLGSLVPTCADEAKAIIPSLEKKCEDGLIDEADLENLCKELGRIKRQTQL